MCNLGRGTTFASAPAIDMTTLNLAGSPTPRDVWACWYATALACVRTGKCDQPCAAAPSTDQVGGDYLVDVGGTLDAASSRVDGAVPTSASVYSIQNYDAQASVAIAALKVRCGAVCDDFEHSCVEARVHCVLGSTFWGCCLAACFSFMLCILSCMRLASPPFVLLFFMLFMELII